jgi:hypothetical protein
MQSDELLARAAGVRGWRGSGAPSLSGGQIGRREGGSGGPVTWRGRRVPSAPSPSGGLRWECRDGATLARLLRAACGSDEGRGGSGGRPAAAGGSRLVPRVAAAAGGRERRKKLLWLWYHIECWEKP